MELFLLSPTHDGTATRPASCAVQVTELRFSLVVSLRLLISDARDLVSALLPSAHESLSPWGSRPCAYLHG